MHKSLLSMVGCLLIAGCHSNANFKSANLIKPHLFPSEPSVLTTPIKEASQTQQLEHFVYFEFNSAQLTAQGQLLLDQHLPILNTIKQGQIVLQGHTDPVGSEADNHLLAKRRALAVWRYLIDAGVDEARLNPVSLGEEGNRHQHKVAVQPDPKQRYVEIIY